MKRYLRTFLEIIIFLALGYAIAWTNEDEVKEPTPPTEIQEEQTPEVETPKKEKNHSPRPKHIFTMYA